jgi:hypothetical protein
MISSWWISSEEEGSNRSTFLKATALNVTLSASAGVATEKRTPDAYPKNADHEKGKYDDCEDDTNFHADAPAVPVVAGQSGGIHFVASNGMEYGFGLVGR